MNFVKKLQKRIKAHYAGSRPPLPGRGLTGASYAALPCGLQLNNYRGLDLDIINSNEHDAEPLSGEKMSIIQRVAEKFSSKKDIYNAAHRGKNWRRTSTGALISYLHADERIEI